MPLRGVPLLILCVSVAFAPAAAFAAPDSATGGVEVPDTPTGGTEGGAFLPQAPEPPATVQPPAQGSGPKATASSHVGAAQAQPAQNDEGDVEVEVPVPPAQPQPTAPAQPSAPLGGLASTGYAAGLLGLLGLLFGAAGLTLLRMSAPARLRRRAERRAARAHDAGHGPRRAPHAPVRAR